MRFSRRKIVILVFLVFVAALFFSRHFILKEIGLFLVISQEPEKADVIVVLNGRDTERSLTAVDLYNGGYGNLIVMARGPKQPGCEQFFERVGRHWNSMVFFQRAISALGVPEHSFKLIGDGTNSTYDEAKAAKCFVRENGYKSILLVTSKWHSKRAYLTFKSVFDNEEEIRIKICPSKYDTFSPHTWWKNEDDAELVFKEYTRLIYYMVTFRISPFIQCKK